MVPIIGAALTEFRPVFILMGLVMLFFFFVALAPNRFRWADFKIILTVSIIIALVALATFLTESRLIKTYALEGDRLTLILLGFVLILAVINPVLYRRNDQRKRRYRYRS